MTAYFFDTSALVKHYHHEPGTARVDGLLDAPGAKVYLSQLTPVELRSTLAKAVRVGLMTPGLYRLLTQRFQADRTAGQYMVARLTRPRYRAAQDLIDRLGQARNLRSLDALQLAVALHLSRPARPVTFVSADQVLCALASAEGLAVINPEVP